jgi:hypothetical protein
MKSQDIIKVGHKARIETEAFINQYINDQAKRWPTLCHCGSAHTGYRQVQQLRRGDIIHTLLTQ